MAKKKTEQRRTCVELVDLAEALRRDLTAAAEGRDSLGEDAVFLVAEATVETEVNVVRETQARGGVKIYLAEVGAHGARRQGNTYRLRLTLKPLPESVDRGVAMLGTRRGR